MKKFAAFILIILLSPTAFADISLTDEQYKNLDVLDKELRKKDSNFAGLSGTQQEMKVIGMSEAQAKREIAKIDIAKAQAEDPVRIKRGALIQKFKTIGFDAEMLAQIGLTEGAK